MCKTARNPNYESPPFQWRSLTKGEGNSHRRASFSEAVCSWGDKVERKAKILRGVTMSQSEPLYESPASLQQTIRGRGCHRAAG